MRSWTSPSFKVENLSSLYALFIGNCPIVVLEATYSLLPLQHDHFDIISLGDDMIDLFALKAQRKGLEFTVVVPYDSNVTLIGDVVRIRSHARRQRFRIDFFSTSLPRPHRRPHCRHTDDF